MKKNIYKLKVMFFSIFGFICMIITVLFWGGSLAILGKLKIISRDVVQYNISLWGRFMLKVSGMKVVVKGRETIDPSRNYIFMFNHQSMLDIPLTVGYIPHFFVMVAKKQLFDMPIFGFILRLVGYIAIDRTNLKKSMKTMKEAGKQVAKGNQSVGMYPEGTRSKTGKMNKFKKGGFIIAMEACIPIVPVTIKNTFKMVRPGKLMLDNIGELELIIHPAVEVNQDSNRDEVMEEVRKRIKSELKE